MTDHLFRETSGKVVSVLTRQFGAHRLEAILDAVQDAFEAALTRWRFSGLPEVPQAWLLTVARRKLLNTLRKEEKTAVLKVVELPDLSMDGRTTEEVYIRDSQFCLLLRCIQLPLGRRDCIMTTLHVLCGFSPLELAKAMGLHFEAVRKSLYRNKIKLAEDQSWINYEPDLADVQQHLPTIHEVLYAMFNEGYKSERKGTPIDISLCYEALRLLQLTGRYAEHSDTESLMALFYFHLSRFPARMDEQGDWLTLENQDRSLWDSRLIMAGFHHLSLAQAHDRLSVWYLEAVIASVHVSSPSFEQTPWLKLQQLYRHWLQIDPDNVMVRLQLHTVGLYYQPSAQLANDLEALRRDIGSSSAYLIDATLSTLYEKLGETKKSSHFLEKAIDGCSLDGDRRLLLKKLKT